MYITDLPLAHWVEVARRQTAYTATVKDWRLRRKIDREAKEEARRLIHDKGYIIATPAELKAKYPQFVDWTPGIDAGEKMVFAFHASVPDRWGRCRISIIRI